MLSYLYIFIGGGLGAVSRFGVGKLILRFTGDSFPFGTLASNVLSCLVMGGILYSSMGAKWLTEDLKLLLIVGFCGGFSTFSTFSMDTLNLFRNGQHLMAALNILVSVIICFVILYLMVQKQKAV